ncbi:MAG: serine protease [Bacteroidales bacterium]|nr:serine protease [Bacteroidales bacterium]
MGLVITLILVGIVLIIAEILLVPGIGVAGILGLLSMGGSCWYAFYEFGNMTGGIVTAVTAVVLVAFAVVVLRAKTWQKMTLNTKIESKVNNITFELRVSDRGRTVTRLAPMGSVRFGNEIVEVKALEGMIDPDIDVEICLMEEGKIYVTPIIR